jgi:hypothetical protein
MYEVYETDADDSMEKDKLIHRGESVDIAESRMVLLYRAAGCMKDYLLYNTTQHKIVCSALSPDTMVKKGICFG